MTSRPLDLPDAIVDAAIDPLDKQAVVFSLAKLFNERPELDSFSFSFAYYEMDGKGNAFPRARAHCAVIAKAPPSEAEFDQTRLAVLRWVDEQTDDWKRSMLDKTFARPTPPESLIEALMRQCLSPEDFSSWQAAGLARAAKPAAASSPRTL